LRRRVEWLEEQGAAGAAIEKTEQMQVMKTQDTICDLVEQVSRLTHTASSGEAKISAMDQQVQQLQVLVDRRQSGDAASRGIPEVEAKVSAVSQQVADLSARLLEVEGGLEFAREIDEVAVITRPKAQEDNGASTGLKEKLEAVAEHLDVVDDLAERVADLERSQAVLGSKGGGGTCGIPASPQHGSEVSFGGDAPIRAISAASLQVIESLPQDVGDLRERLVGLELNVKSLHHSVCKHEPIAHELERSLKTDFGKFNEVAKTVANLETPSRGMIAMERDLKALREEVAASSARITTEDLDKLRQDLRKLGVRLGAMESSVVALEGSMAECTADREALAKLRKQVEENLQCMVSQSVPGGGGKLTAAEIATEVRVEVLAAKDAAAKALASSGQLKDRFTERFGCLEERVAAAMEEAAAAVKRTLALEERLDEDGLASNASMEEAARAQVQKKVEELEAKVLDEFGGLAEHQQELSGLGANVEGLVEKVASVVKRCGDVEALVHRGGNKDIASLRQQLEDLRKRVLVAVETAESARKDVEMLQGPRKVGISPGGTGRSCSSLAAVNERLDELAEKVIELKELPKIRNHRCSDGPLHQQELAPECSLNFSLTEQSERPMHAGHEDSLNFSLTESKREMSLSEPMHSAPGTNGMSGPHTADTEPFHPNFEDMAFGDSSDGSAGLPSGLVSPTAQDESLHDFSKDSSLAVTSKDPMRNQAKREPSSRSRLGELPSIGVGGRRSSWTPPGGGGAGGGVKGSCDVLDALMSNRPGGGDILDGLAGGKPHAKSEGEDTRAMVGVGGSGSSLASASSGTSTLSGRPRPAALGLDDDSGRVLATVAEEDLSDLAEHSHESRNSMGQDCVAKQDLVRSSTGGDAHLEASTSFASQSGLEVSMAPDYSVEDSLELEMCDHVEVVQLTPKHRASGCDDTGGPPANDSAARGIEAGANDDVAATLRKTAMAFGALESLTPSLSTGAVAASGALEPSAIGAKDDGDNDYGHESFEDDMSVPESILDDSQDGSGSER